MSDEKGVSPPPGVRVEALSEADLIRLAQAGREEALQELVRLHSGRVFKLAYHTLGDHDAAQDILQDSFLRFFKSLSRVDPRKGAAAWLNRIAINLIRDRLRKKKRSAGEVAFRDELTATEIEPPDVAHANNVRRSVWQALQKLPEKYRMALVMREMQGMSPQEIARIINCNQATARWRIHKARLLFKEAWDEQGGIKP